jgi:hypothetical protein
MTLLQSFKAELQTFRGEVEGFLAGSGMRPTTFGVTAVGDPRFVFDLREGRQPGPEMIDKVRRFMREQGSAAA